MTTWAEESEEWKTRWPRKGDRLFIETACAYDALVVGDPRERFYRLPMGYKRAGDILIEQAGADVVDRVNVIYAALFCYRQSIELFLKCLIDEFGGASPRDTHDLQVLWDRFMGIVRQCLPNGTDGLEAAQSLVTEMHEADEKADGFRFPTGRNGLAFAFADRRIDLGNVHAVMQGLANFFECAYMDFAHRADMPG